LGLINKGAQVILGEGHLLELLGSIPTLNPGLPAHSTQPTPPPNLAPELQHVLQALSEESMPFDWIVRQTGSSSGAVSSALLQLELLGLVTQLPGMRYQRLF
jgi:DNA processing protein